MTSRELNAKVAGDVMGWNLFHDSTGMQYWRNSEGQYQKANMDWNPSEDWSCMEMVVERMEELGYRLWVRDGHVFFAGKGIDRWGRSSPFTSVNKLPRAVSEAALKAVTI